MNRIADLFCGAGGTSTGILAACRDLGRPVELLAVNHWQTAINSHSLNHPEVRHICGRLENIKPHEAVPSGRLNLLAASPECTHHSIAAGGRPKNDQSRCQAWLVCDWLSQLKVDALLIENVREFKDWGPLTARLKPSKRYKGKYFKAFLSSLTNMGYHVDWRIVNAADYGDPTSRKRLLIMARRGKKFAWPEVTHGTGDLQPYRTAREIIDWNLKGQSIFQRKRPLSPNTLRRIGAGLRKFGGAQAEPFLVMLYGTNDARSVDRPTPAVTANGGHIALAEPFIITMEHQGSVRSADRPLPVITTAKGGAMAVCQPFITHLTHHGQRRQHSVDAPTPTVTGAHRGELALIEPILLGQQSGHNGSPVSEPCPTVATSGAIGLVEPFIVKYYGNERAGESIHQPLDTVTCKDRFMLVEPKTGRAVAELDILFRMLQPHELAAAMSFPKEYKFTGTRGDQVKQIGNAVPVELARAHARTLLQ